MGNNGLGLFQRRALEGRPVRRSRFNRRGTLAQVAGGRGS